MKILFVNISIPGFAGDAVQLQHIIKGLEKLGHEVTLVISDGDSYYFDKEKSKSYSIVRKKLLDAKGKPVKINGITVNPIHCISSKMGLYCPTAKKVAKRIIKNYDVVYTTNWYYHLALVFSKVAREYHVPFIISGMGAFQEKARNLKKWRKRVIDKLYTKDMISHADGFHSVGDLETEEYEKLGASPDKIYRIDHGVVLDNFLIKETTNIHERIGIDAKHDNYIITIGRIDPKKGLEILLEAFSKIHKDYEKLILVVVGSGTKNYVEKIKQLAVKLKIENFVKFTGFVTEPEKLELLESAKFFVGTSHSDVHATTVLEAMTMGLPIIITKASDFPEVDEYDAGVTVDTNPDSVYKALNQILNSGKLEQYSDNAKRLINDRFLLEDRIKEFEMMFQKVTS